MADPVIPAAIESEMAVLGEMMTYTASADTGLESLTDDDFYLPKHQTIFRAICKIRNQGNVPDISTVPVELENMGKLKDIGGRHYIFELADAGSGSMAYHIPQVIAKRILRQLLNLSSEIRSETMKPETEANEYLEKVETKIFAIRDHTPKKDAVVIGQIIEGVYDSMEKYQQDKTLAGIPSGIPELDERILGFNDGEMILIAGRPSSGKTALAMQITENLGIAKIPVFMFSLEMTKEMLTQRMVCGMAGVSSFDYRARKITDTGWTELARAGGIISSATIHIDDSGSLSINELRARARRAKSKYGIKLLMIDYLQLLHGPKSESKQQEVTAISQGIKEIAKELHVPVIALSQLSRAVESRGEEARPKLSDLRESGSLEQDADLVIFIHRKRDKKGLYLSDAEVIIGKQRNGPPDFFEMTFVADRTKFMPKAYRENLPEPYGMKD